MARAESEPSSRACHRTGEEEPVQAAEPEPGTPEGPPPEAEEARSSWGQGYRFLTEALRTE